MAAPVGNKNALDNTGGRPSSYKDEYAEQAYKLCLLGFTDKELSKFFGVSRSTLNQWKKHVIEFSDKLKEGKTIADGEVAASLYKRAIGFEYDETTWEKVEAMEMVNTEFIKVDAYKKKIVTKLVIPDTGAQTMWLKNRQREFWRDKQDLGLDFENMPDDMLDNIIARLTEKAKA